MTDLMARVLEHSKNNPYDFTLDLETLRPVNFGFSVAFRETQDGFGTEGLEKAIRHAMENEGTIGGWLDEETGRYHFDSVRVFAETAFGAAVEFARENGQLAFYNLTDEEEIRMKPEGL